MKNIHKYFIFGLLTPLLWMGCQEEVFKQIDQSYVHNVSMPIVLTSFAPMEGSEAAEISIDGDNFSTDISKIQVLVNGVEVPILGANKKRIIVKIPQGTGTGKIRIKIGNQEIESKDSFIYALKRTVSTYALSGNGATFNFFVNAGMDIDSKGNLYVADVFNNCIRKISASGEISTYAGISGQEGNVNGSTQVALFNHPTDIAFDADDNMYVADTWNWAIRKVSTAGEVSTVKAWVVPFPQGITFNRSNSSLYIVSALPAASQGKMFELKADGQFVERSVDVPIVSGGICLDKNNQLIIADNGKSVIYRINPTTWTKEIIAGSENQKGWQDGVGEQARFNHPWGVAVDKDNNIYVAGSGHLFDNPDIATNASNIRMIESGTNKVSTIAGGGTMGFFDGLGGEAKFAVPTDLVVDASGVIYVLDKGNLRIRKIITE